MVFLDVGQGDCTLVIDWPTMSAVVIDCKSGSASRVLNVVRAGGLRIAAIIVTHLDLDHVGDVPSVAGSAEAKGSIVYINKDSVFGDDRSNSRLRTVMEGLHDLQLSGHITQQACYVGMPVEPVGSLDWDWVWPIYGLTFMSTLRSQRNHGSVVTRFNFPNCVVLISGDADGSAWQTLLTRDQKQVRSDVFRTPHHGAEMAGPASSAAVLAAVGASHSVVSVGATNDYAHPDQNLLRLAASSARLLCTEVTPACLGAQTKSEHRAAAKGGLDSSPPKAPACAGDVVVHLYDDGRWAVSPGAIQHGRRIDGWSHPQCR